MSVSRFANEKLRRENSPSGSIGCGVRRSHQTNVASSARPTRSGTKISGELQPRFGSSISAKTGPPSPRTQRRPPTKSTFARGACGARFGTAYATSSAVTSANGTLMKNTQRHDAFVTSQPPASGPITNATPVHAVHAPIAAPRSSPLKVDAITARPAGGGTAPARPPRPPAGNSGVPAGGAGPSTAGGAEGRGP